MRHSGEASLSVLAITLTLSALMPSAAQAQDSAVPPGEIIVTAQKRSESVQRTPVAIDVVSTATVQNANITTMTGLSRIVPAVQIVQAAGATPLYFMRGVGSLSGTSLNDPAVSLSYDGVPLFRQYQGNGQFYDLARVEVLRGPQGTLYGRNATGGVISFVPTAPKLGDTSGSLGVTVGNYNEIDTRGTLNVALGDKAALRASFQTAQHDGYLNDGEQDDKARSARLQFYAEPHAGLRIKVAADYSYQGQLGGGYALVDQSFFNGYAAGTQKITAEDRVGYLSPRGQLYFAARNRGRPYQTPNLHFNNNFYGLHAVVDVDTPIGTLTVQPAWRHADLDYYAVNAFALNIAEHDDQYSLETRLTSKAGGRLTWILGAFLAKDDVDAGYIYDNFNQTGSIAHYRQISKSAAVFADATLRLTDRLRLLGGIRYTHDTKEANGGQTDLVGGSQIPLAGNRSWDATNWRAGFQFDVAPRIMVYGTAATGFHAGGFYFSHVVLPTDSNSVEPERITAFTLGAKTRLLDNKLTLNLEAFHWGLTGQQVSLFTLDSQGATIFPTYNAGKSTSKGVQVDLQYQPTRLTSLGAQVEYLDAVFNSLTYVQSLPVQPGFLCQTSGAAPQLRVDCSGQRPPQAPQWSLNLTADQTVELPSGAGITFGWRAHFQSSTITGFNYLPDDIQKAVWQHDLTATYKPEGGAWDLGVYVNNLTDAVIKSNATHAANVQAYQLRPPRTFGARFNLHF
ncbi:MULTISPECIES: TonB-dependent receptor [unclassified Novosphingobium]|uniref:TonB-dependent receptor n=1 Tax=unclassified Novosphingobium TaxID=2644732 RepID=UPI000A45B94E|nr:MULTISPECIES: TonB-dependent receptor [unclassified Novosphingobium]MBN9143659.1 TonB-dependent receptor [Novosphingobium sp.]MDR6706912.1 iron complex outermembrane receptor protein [Novosphingobium sp. 1748]